MTRNNGYRCWELSCGPAGLYVVVLSTVGRRQDDNLIRDRWRRSVYRYVAGRAAICCRRGMLAYRWRPLRRPAVVSGANHQLNRSRRDQSFADQQHPSAIISNRPAQTPQPTANVRLTGSQSVVRSETQLTLSTDACWWRGTVVERRRTFPVLRSTCTSDQFVCKSSDTRQPTRPTQPFILSGTINEL